VRLREVSFRAEPRSGEVEESQGSRGFNAFVVLPAIALFMVGVGAIAALGPARRGLTIQPGVVLKDD